MSSYRGMDASLYLGFALCCHSNATCAPIANPPNSAQLGGIIYYARKLDPGPCNSVGIRPRTVRHTDTQTRVTTIHFASSMTHAKCNDRYKEINEQNNHKQYRQRMAMSNKAIRRYQTSPALCTPIIPVPGLRSEFSGFLYALAWHTE